jgi:hypothetical protein
MSPYYHCLEREARDMFLRLIKPHLTISIRGYKPGLYNYAHDRAQLKNSKKGTSETIMSVNVKYV